MKQITKRISNRVYEERICLQSGKKFIPTDARQKFRSAQDRINYHNDQRKIKDAPLKELTTRVLKNEAILGKIFNTFDKRGKADLAFNKTLLDYEDYDFEIHHERGLNPETKRQIEWFFYYGLEVADVETKSFFVRKRNFK